MIDKPRAGLLPLYLKLYDDTMPNVREAFAPFMDNVEAGLVKAGLEVVRAPVCRIKSEFAAGVRQLEDGRADAIVCLHLAYSPSLESAAVLARSPLPLVLLDTTMDHDFGRDADPERLIYNHGVHGVQDLACMLRRRGRPFEIVAGHWAESDVLARAAEMVRAARAAGRLRNCKALRIGKAFAGMGDFAVDERVLARKLGISVVQVGVNDLLQAAAAVTNEQIETEMRLDHRYFAGEIDETVHRNSSAAGLALRRFLEDGKFGAFSANFQAFDMPDGPICTVPFLEISKAMSRGIGYAGEGDVLTAAMVGALLSAWPQTTFTEIFCPDWKG
ncbi:MAG TPA: hypothetical protein VM098_04160, partial [Phycisphaerae bacterium]|nr:hypothetical protein [Phycisphaerae bacterium]